MRRGRPAPRRVAIGLAAVGGASGLLLMLLGAGAVAAAMLPGLGMAAALGLFALGVGVSLLVARRVARALASLTAEAEALRALEVARPLPVETGLAELDRLGDAMRQMKQAIGLFGVYVPRDLVRQLLAQDAEATLGGERRQLTVLFTDVRDFTRLAEPIAPEELMRIASAYFEAVTAELLRNHATIDKYIGDAVMALWNAPRRDLAHALHGCLGALGVRAVTRELAVRFAARGWPPLVTRFGLHSGEAVVGNVGSSDRMSYTAIGSMVNLASRLEGLNKVYGTEILVSDATLRGAGSRFVARPVDLVMPKGTGAPIGIHELIGLSDAREAGEGRLIADPAVVARLPAWREMVAHYRAGAFAAAEAALARAGGAGADPLAALYAGQLARLRADPPAPEAWSPVVSYAEK